MGSPAPVATGPSGEPARVTAQVKPRFRGVSHQVAFFVAVGVGAVVALAAPRGAWPELGVYLVAIPGLFGVSALFHRPTWSPAARLRMRRLDHSMIFLAIAATYTAVTGLAMGGPTRTVVLVAVWAGAAVGVSAKLIWIDAPKWVSALAYLAIGWIAVAVLPQLAQALGWAGFGLLALGGAFYTVGAVVYARQRPDPVPSVFGYHEVFHALVIAGATSHYLLVVFVVLPGLERV